MTTMDAGDTVRVAVDVGGTFTDVFVLDSSGETRVAKTPSTLDPMEGVLRAWPRPASTGPT